MSYGRDYSSKRGADGKRYLTFEKYTRTTHEQVGCSEVSRFNTSLVTFTYPPHIERVYRFLNRYFPDDYKKFLPYNPFHPTTKPFGMWMEFTETTIRVRSICNHFHSYDDIDTTYNVSTPLLLRLALRGIIDILAYQRNIRNERNPLK
jgi:hypothetical protein